MHFFGEIVNGRIQLTELGKQAEIFWHEIPNQFNFIQIAAFVVMPNHIHGILIINDDGDGPPSPPRSPPSPYQSPNPNTGGITGSKNPMLNENISRVIRWYKGRCAFEMRKTDAGFGWQTRFHDHIIRNEMEYERISHYIVTNPASWEPDKHCKKQE